MVAGHLRIKRGVYQIVINYVDSDGHKRQKSMSTGLKIKGNKKRAQEKLEEVRRSFEEPAQDKVHDLISMDMLYTDFLTTWLDLKKDSIATTTYAGYCREVNDKICPYFMKLGLKVSEVKPSDIQNFYNEQRKRVKGSTIKHYHNIIHSSFKYLMRLDLIQSNPADRVMLPRKEKFIGDYYNEEDLNRLFEVSKNHPLGLLIQVTACYGLRREEVIGLKWSAIDFEENTLTIKHVVTSVKLDGKSQLIMEDRAKTKSSLRTLPLLGDIKEQLLDLRKRQERNKRLCKASYNHEYDEYIFVDALGNIYKPDYVTSGFRNLLKKNNLKPIRFHDLRHSCATLLLAHEVPMKLIQEWLGHSDIGTTANIYSHTDYKTKMVSAGIMDGTLNFPKSLE